IAQACTQANGTADAAIAAHTLLTQSGWGHSTNCRRGCLRRRTRPLEATKQKIKKPLGTRPAGTAAPVITVNAPTRKAVRQIERLVACSLSAMKSLSWACHSGRERSSLSG